MPRRRPRTVVPEGLIAPAAAPPPVPQNAVRQLLQNTFGPLFPGGAVDGRLIIADRAYIPVDAGWLRTLVTSDPQLGPSSYRGDVFDCDDYVMYLKCKTSLVARRDELRSPLAVGFVLTQRHAFNFCIGVGGTVAIIDTQSDAVAVCADPQNFPQALALGMGNALDLVYI